jgi:3',5'-cyclic AMP phosphodiesterase CpdA
LNVRLAVSLGTLGLGAALAPAAFAAPFTTAERTIQDCDADNLLEFNPGERHTFVGTVEEDDDSCNQDESGRPYRLPNDHSIINFLQLSDFQIVDEESPARVEFLDTTQRGPSSPFSAAYRPQESLTTQVTEAMVRQARDTVSPVTGETLDLSILTGDNADSQQYNETRWFIDILDGTADRRPPEFEDKVDPNSGIPTETDPATGAPTEACDGTPGTIYDGVRGGGKFGYYEPDSSEGQEDGDGYSPRREENFAETPGRNVTVRDFPGLFEAANQPFESIGLDMPWYSAIGNHDALVQGNSPEAYFGPGGPGDPPPTPEERFNPVYHAIATGCVKPSNLPEPLATDLEELLDSDPSPAELEQFAESVRDEMAAFLADPGEGAAATTQAVPPDSRRCFLAKDLPTLGPPLSPCEHTSWIGEHFKTTGTPVGHGFEKRPPQAVTHHDGYYSFVPRAGLRFIVLDTVTDECGSEFCSEGSVDDPQFRWLEDEFEAARAAGEYVLVFSHHTLRTTRQPFTARDLAEEPIHYGQRLDRQNVANPQNVTIGDSLEELYCRNTDVLLGHIAGHEHENYVERRECLANEVLEGAPELFWHVSTAAHIDWPQQSRMIELVTDGGQLELVLTMLDHAGPAYPGAPRPGEMTRGDAGEQILRLAGIAREIAYNDYQASRGATGERSDRNVIIPLHRPWPYPTDLAE